MGINITYRTLLSHINSYGEETQARNGLTHRCYDLPTINFNRTPLVTVRRTLWKKAIREMEWFLSGSPKCPDELLDWWGEQLSPNGLYLDGYTDQFRSFNFDQVNHLISKLQSDPFSREHIITTWNPAKMASIKVTNNNPRTPACCHSTVVQFFVTKDHFLSMHSYQRSADMLLGVPHNWIQSWAFLLWVAAQTGLIPDRMLWTFGDAHIYLEPSHTEAAKQIIEKTPIIENTHLTPRLVYSGKPKDPFKAADFAMVGNIPEPLVTIRPKLL